MNGVDIYTEEFILIFVMPYLKYFPLKHWTLLMKKHLLIVFASLLPTVLLAADDKKPQAIPVMVVEVKNSDQTLSQDLPGRIAAYRVAEVRARVTGIIEKRIFVEGSHVEAGQELFKIEDRSLRATYRARKADVANASAAYSLSRQTLARYKKLLSLGAVSRQEYDSNSAQNQQSRAQLQQAKANLEIAEINLEYATVKAPIAGRIDRALVTEGALTSKDSTQLATIEQIDKVYINFTHPSNTNTNQGTNTSTLKNIQVSFSNGSQYPHLAQLEFSSMSVDQATGAISLRAVVENPETALLPGMFVRVKMPTNTASSQLYIPQKAVKITPQGASVHIVRDKKLTPVSIVLGAMNGTNWFIKSGLKSGDRVVVSDTSILGTLPNAQFIGMTGAEMQAAGMAKKQN
jgi:membrane fusion protein (multidrug efflux system)